MVIELKLNHNIMFAEVSMVVCGGDAVYSLLFDGPCPGNGHTLPDQVIHSGLLFLIAALRFKFTI